jgi:uncharacterized protein
VSLSVEAGRVLGCLVEKQLTTPQQYPLTLNGLSAACNQTTNRQPVMDLEERTIERALDELKALGLVRFVLPSHGKSVTRYRHVLDQAYGLDTQQVALLAVLMLRGPQTSGELRARTERMAELDSIDAVLHELEFLAGRPEHLVTLLARRPGQKEDRWAQLLAAEAGVTDPPDGTDVVSSQPVMRTAESLPDPSAVHRPSGRQPEETVPTGDLTQRVESLEIRVAELARQVEALTTSLGRLRRNLGDDASDPGPADH